jgi:hypothetical protein
MSRIACFPRSRAALMAALLAAPLAAQTPYMGVGSLSGPDSAFGQSVAQAHDMNGDGRPEVLIGAPGADNNGTDSGTVYVIDGVYGWVVDQVHGLAGDELGFSLANLGDVDGDGVDDFAAGRPGRDHNGTDTGAVSVYSGDGADILWTQLGPKAGAHHGSVVAAAGDVDGDGRGDVLVGAPLYDGPVFLADTDWGRVVLYSGDNGLPLETITGDTKGDRLGAALASVGDLTGDGRPEFAIGIPGDDVGSPFGILDAGSVRIFNAATQALMTTVNGTAVSEACGSSIAALGDTDHDGQQEFAIGRPDWSSGRGRVSVHESKAANLVVMLEGPTLPPTTGYGTVVAGAGDVNKDGHVDLIVAGPAEGTEYGGWSHVISGANWTQYLDAYASYAGIGFGTNVSAGLDTSGDGWVDALYGMPGADFDGTDAGLVWAYRYTHYQPNILFGGPGTASLQIYGTHLYAGGKADLLVAGAPADVPVFLLASPVEAPAPFKGGVIVPQLSTALLITLFTDASGQVKLTSIPGGGGPVIAFLQALIPYVGGPQGYWITNAVACELLP